MTVPNHLPGIQLIEWLESRICDDLQTLLFIDGIDRTFGGMDWTYELTRVDTYEHPARSRYRVEVRLVSPVGISTDLADKIWRYVVRSSNVVHDVVRWSADTMRMNVMIEDAYVVEGLRRSGGRVMHTKKPPLLELLWNAVYSGREQWASENSSDC